MALDWKFGATVKLMAESATGLVVCASSTCNFMLTAEIYNNKKRNNCMWKIWEKACLEKKNRFISDQSKCKYNERDNV